MHIQLEAAFHVAYPPSARPRATYSGASAAGNPLMGFTNRKKRGRLNFVLRDKKLVRPLSHYLRNKRRNLTYQPTNIQR